MTLRNILLGAAVVVVSFFVALFAIDWLFPTAGTRPKLAAVPPLPQVSRNSVMIAPVSIALTAIRDAIEAKAPRDLSGQRDNPLSQLLGKADIGWTMTRSPFTVTGGNDRLAIATALDGTLRVTGQIAVQAGNVTAVIGSLIGDSIGRGAQQLTNRSLDQRAEIRGNVHVTSKPVLLPAWRIDPNLTAQVALANGGLSIAGVRINVSNEMKPLLDKTVNEQVAKLQSHIRSDPFLEVAARREWAKMCRSIALGDGKGGGLPKLWLEMKPKRAFAAQPQVNSRAVVLTLGVQAETRITASETKPDCPFPSQIDLVPPLQRGDIKIGVPIDVPFTALNTLLDAQLKGRRFPDDGSGPAEVTVRHARLSASGDRLLIALDVKVKEQKSWFGLGTTATVYVWGRPQLDPAQQILRFTDLSVDVQSEAAFGLIGAAARAAIPYLQDALAQNAVIDLKPFAADARKSIATAITDFQKSSNGINVDAAVTDLRLADIAFDSKTLRIVAEVNGTAQVAVSRLP